MDKSNKNQGRNQNRDADGRYESNNKGSNAKKGNQGSSGFDPKQHPRDEEGRFTDK